MNPELKQAVEDSNKVITALRAEVDALKGSMDGLDKDKISKMEADLATAISEKSALEQRLVAVENAKGRPGVAGVKSEMTEEHKSLFFDNLRNPTEAKTAKLLELQEKAAFTTTDGSIAIPKEISSVISAIETDMSVMRSLARVVTAGADYSELLDVKGTGARWVGEGDDLTGSTSGPGLVQVKPVYGMLNARPEATLQALQDVFFDLETFISQGIGEQFALAEEIAFVGGDGVDKPKGFLAAPKAATADATRAQGTLQYFATGVANDLAASPFDTLNRLVFGTKAGYRANGKFALNSLTLARHATVKDTTGNYILRQSVAAGLPDMLLGYATAIVEAMPDIAADATPIAFGDFKRGYLIADRPVISIIRDNVTKPGFVAWNAFKRVGGSVKDTRAIKLLKIAAA